MYVQRCVFVEASAAESAFRGAWWVEVRVRRRAGGSQCTLGLSACTPQQSMVDTSVGQVLLSVRPPVCLLRIRKVLVLRLGVLGVEEEEGKADDEVREEKHRALHATATVRTGGHDRKV